MFLAIQSSGSKSFYVIKKIAGRSEKIFLGSYPSLTIENARKMASIKLGQIAVGINPQEQKRTIRAEMTFGQLFEQYVTRYSRIHKKTWKADQSDLTRFMGHWFKRKLSDIKPAEIRQLIETIYTDNGRYQANKMLQRLRAVYKKGIEWGWQGLNPTIGIKKYPEKSRDRFIQPDEMPWFIKSLEEEPDETIRDFFWCLLLLGARKTNTVMMRWDELNWERQEWRIPHTKNG
ncbi:integrase arm-type DNA-binding domain-containing protein [Daejeonella sp.]|uniref:tyrosine-type recombinase/integrase n=1 Tax=Daejeonella sp. TaxID=2805397 RepID=UPI0030C507B0